MPRGSAEIEVTFDLDVNAELFVSAVEKSSGKKKELIIVNDKGRFSKDDNEDLSEEEKEEKKETKEEEKYETEYDNKVKNKLKKFLSL